MEDTVSSSSAHRVLGNAYILSLIFSFQDNDTLTKCTRVCKAWFDPAADAIWREVPEIYCIIGILINEGAGNGNYEGVIGAPKELKNWTRFDVYAKRIQSLGPLPSLDSAFYKSEISGRRPSYRYYNNRHSSSPNQNSPFPMSLDSFVFPKLTRMRPNLDQIFPRMRTLTVVLNEIESFYKLSVLLQPTLRTLCVRFGLNYTGSDYKEMFQLITDRSPSLEKIIVSFEKRSEGLDEILVSLFVSLPKLSDISFSQSFMTPPVMKQLAKLPRLRGIHAVKESPKSPRSPDEPPTPPPPPINGPNVEFDPMTDWPMFPPPVTQPNPGPPISFFDMDMAEFPSLTHFSIELDLDKATEFFRKQTSLGQLVSLELRARDPDDLSKLTTFLNLLAERCPCLERLGFTFHWHFIVATPNQKQISYEHLQILLSFNRLVDFSISFALSQMYIQLTDEEVDSLTAKWSSLKHFHVKPTSHGRQFNLSALTVFAKNCPDLQTLTLPLDTFCDPPLSHSTTHFKNLNQLHLHGSSVKHPDKMAIFLSNLLPPFCVLDHPGKGIRQSRTEYAFGDESPTPWRKVVDHLKLIDLYRMHIVAKESCS